MSDPLHSISTTITPTGGGSITIGAPTSTLTSVLAPFFRGPAGAVEESFESVSKNLKTNPAVLNYTSGNLTSVNYTTPTGSITKTLNYTAGKLTSIVLSGSALPENIQTTKTLQYSDEALVGVTYS